MALRRFIIYLITGILLGLSYPPFDFYQLFFPGIALLMYIVHTSGSYRRLFLSGYVTFLVFDLLALSWIPLSGVRENADRFLILGGTATIIIHCALLTIPLLIYRFIYENLKNKVNENIAIFTFPLLITGFEYLSTLSEFSFPWFLAGNAFTTNLEKIQFADITGVYGVSLWAYLISVLLYILLGLVSEGGRNIKSIYGTKSFVTVSIVLVVIFVLPNIYTTLANSPVKYGADNTDEKITVAVIQPDINPWKKWGSKQTELTNDYAEQIRIASGTGSSLKMIVLPETATPFYLLDPFYEDKYRIFKNVCDSINIPILTGTPDRIIYTDSSEARADSKLIKSSGLFYDTFNSAVLILPGKNKEKFQRYAKNKLVIGSERMPYQEKISFLKSIVSWSVGLSSYQTGTDTTIFVLDDKYRFATAICYESIYPDYFAGFIRKGAEFAVIITNDGWWGKLQGTYQHSQYAVLRAIENRRWIVRCANTGISSVIDPYGRMHSKTGINERAVFPEEVGIKNEITFYTQNGDFLPKISLIISGLVFVFAAVSGYGNKLLKLFRKKTDNS